MSGVFSTRVARRRAVTYAAAVAISLILLALSSNPVVREVQGGVYFAFKPILSAIDGAAGDIRSIVNAVGEIDRLRVDNGQLRDENDRLRIENRRAEEVRRENELLTGLLQLRNGFEYETVAASVIGRESSELRRVVVVDRGSDDGVEVGDVVIAAGGALAGRVIDAGSSFARVLLISDTSSTAIGQLGGSAATGEVVGQLGGALVMQNVDSTATVAIGDEVVTAGIELSGGIRSPYPKGLLIGRVIDVAKNPLEIVQTVYLEPAASLDQLEYVLVILDYKGGIPNPSDGPVQCGPTPSGRLPDSDQPCASAPPATPRPSKR